MSNIDNTDNEVIGIFGNLKCIESYVNENGYKEFTEGLYYPVNIIGACDMVGECAVLDDNYIISPIIMHGDFFDKHFEWMCVDEMGQELSKTST
jgi:hypothetical protein